MRPDPLSVLIAALFSGAVLAGLLAHQLCHLAGPAVGPTPPGTLEECIEACEPFGLATFERDRACYCQTVNVECQ